MHKQKTVTIKILVGQQANQNVSVCSESEENSILKKTKLFGEVRKIVNDLSWLLVWLGWILFCWGNIIDMLGLKWKDQMKIR